MINPLCGESGQCFAPGYTSFLIFQVIYRLAVDITSIQSTLPAGVLIVASDPLSRLTTRLGFFIVEDFSMLPFSAAIEPLRMANRISDQALYDWSIISEQGAPVKASNESKIDVDYSINEAPGFDIVFICGGIDVEKKITPEILNWCQHLSSQHIIMGAICTGSLILAHAGLLKGYRCTIHWENMPGMQEAFPDTIISQELFVIDRDRLTCGGGIAPLDMMLTIIRENFGNTLAAEISEEYLCDRIRDQQDHQKIPLRHILGTSQPKLSEVVELMESNIEEPISLDELAGHVNLSRRQLERLFRKHLNCVPTRYYLEIRLRRARQLLHQTNQSIVEIALACGFVSAPHFSKCYRDLFKVPPREDRRRHE